MVQDRRPVCLAHTALPSSMHCASTEGFALRPVPTRCRTLCPHSQSRAHANGERSSVVYQSRRNTRRRHRSHRRATVGAARRPRGVRAVRVRPVRRLPRTNARTARGPSERLTGQHQYGSTAMAGPCHQVQAGHDQGQTHDQHRLDTLPQDEPGGEQAEQRGEQGERGERADRVLGEQPVPQEVAGESPHQGLVERARRRPRR